MNCNGSAMIPLEVTDDHKPRLVRSLSLNRGIRYQLLLNTNEDQIRACESAIEIMAAKNDVKYKVGN